MGLRFSEQFELRIGPTLSSVNAAAILEGQPVQVSATSQDTTINMGKSTVTAGDDVTEVAQSFTADCSFVSKIDGYVGKAGTPTDYIVVKLYEDNSNAPGTIMNTSTTQLTAADLSTTPGVKSFVFDPAAQTIPMTKGQKYWLVFDRTGSASDTNYYKVNYNSTSTVADHVLARSDNNMSSWTVDAGGDDLYHVVYFGNTGHRATGVDITGGERDLVSQKLLGYNEARDLKRATPMVIKFNRIFQDIEEAEWACGLPVTVTGTAYYRVQGGEKTSNDREAKCFLLYWTDGTNHISILANNAYASLGPPKVSADNHAEVEVTLKCLAADYYYEDDFT
jgi:hypothetical protein